MADSKITALTANTTPAVTDIMPMVDDPGGIPTTQKMTFSDFLKVINGLTADASPDATADYVPTYDASASAAKKVLLSTLLKERPNSGYKNRLINGDFQVAQRGTSFTSATAYPNNDDAYTLDRWYILSDGNDIVDVTQETSTVPTNQLYAIALDVETINKKFGIAQIIEQKNCVDLIGGNVTLSFKAKVSSTTKLDNVKCAVIAWSGTADTVTSDLISAWGIEGTNPTLIANATYENTPANLSLTTSYATYSVTANVDTASTKNIIVFIWSDVTDTTLGDFLYITDVQLEDGSFATDFERRLTGTEISLCERYFEVISAASDGTAATYGVAQCASTTRALNSLRFRTLKRSVPTVTLSAISDWAFYDSTITNWKVWTSFSVGATPAGCHFDVSVASGLGGAGTATLMAPNGSTTAARVYVNAEL